MSGLPVLDLTRFRSAERDAFLDDLRRAARDVGFFTVVSWAFERDGVTIAAMAAVATAARRVRVCIGDSF